MNNWLSKAVALILIFFLFACLSGKEVDLPHEGFEAKRLTYREQEFDVVRLDPASNELAFYLENEAGEKYRSLDKLKETLERKGKTVLFLMNGGMYLKDGRPQGLYIEKGEQIKAVDTIQNAYPKQAHISIFGFWTFALKSLLCGATMNDFIVLILSTQPCILRTV